MGQSPMQLFLGHHATLLPTKSTGQKMVRENCFCQGNQPLGKGKLKLKQNFVGI